MNRILCTFLAAAAIAGAGQAQIHVTNCNDTGPGTLREAILAANASAGPDDIVFDLSCSLIQVATDLPALTDSDTRILGDSAPDDLSGVDIVIEANGATNGLTIDGATNCVIRGVRVQAFPGWGIGLINGASFNQIGGTGAREEVIAADNGVGLRMANTGTGDNIALNGQYFGNSGPGVALVDGASRNIVGAATPSAANQIYNNTSFGVRVQSNGPATDQNVVEGNFIGTDAAGTLGIGNGLEGVRIVGTCTANELRSNIIVHNGLHGAYLQASGNLVGPANLISGNAMDGVHIGPGSTVTGNEVFENWIGLDPLGVGPVPNAGHGVVLRDGVSLQNVHDNVISGNAQDGVSLYGNDPHHNLFEKNWIGLAASGVATVPNGQHGIHAHSVASENTFLQNTVAANPGYGIYFEECGSDLNWVQGNYVGTLPDGSTPAGNGMGGIRLESDANIIGGPNPGEGNVICANNGWGIEAVGPNCSGTFPVVIDNRIAGNLIGEALDGSAAGNAAGGIWLADGLVDTWIGDDPSVPGAGNTIRNNAGPGVRVGQPGAVNVPIQNRILTNSMGGNAGVGIALVAGGNDMLVSPVITGVTATQVDGTNTLAGCGASTLVQVFTTTGDEGETFLGQTTVSSASATWTLLVAVPAGSSVVATNTSTCPGRPTEQTSGVSAPMSLGVGTPYCFGDGSGAACPCANTGGAGEGCAHGLGYGALLGASGSASIAADDLVLEGSQLVTGQPGLYFQGNNQVAGGNGVPFGDGLRCVGGGVRRIQIRTANPAGTSSTTISVATAGAVMAGDTKYYQLWYRTPGASPCGNNFNLSPGLCITWAL